MENELVIELRRRRITLMSLGSGVISFGIWSITKTLLYIYVGVFKLDAATAPEQYRQAATAVAYVLLALFMLIGLSLRLFVGLKARAAGSGKRQRPTYIVVACLLLAWSILTLLVAVFSRTSGRMENQSVMDYAVSMFVECCSAAMLAELIYTALRVRKLAKLVEG